MIPGSQQIKTAFIRAVLPRFVIQTKETIRTAFDKNYFNFPLTFVLECLLSAPSTVWNDENAF